MSQKMMPLLQKKYLFNNRIRIILKVAIKLLDLIFNVACHVDNKFCVENMHILANMRPQICIKGRLIFSSKFVTFLGVTKGEGVQGES